MITNREYIPKIGDYVQIVKSNLNWSSQMDVYVGKTVQVTKVTKCPNKIATIRFKDDGVWTWTVKDKHFIPVNNVNNIDNVDIF